MRTPFNFKEKLGGSVGADKHPYPVEVRKRVLDGHLAAFCIPVCALYIFVSGEGLM